MSQTDTVEGVCVLHTAHSELTQYDQMPRTHLSCVLWRTSRLAYSISAEFAGSKAQMRALNRVDDGTAPYSVHVGLVHT